MARRKLIAAIDVGSNALMMSIAQSGEDGRPEVIETVRGNLALGIDTYNEQTISDESMAILIRQLHGFKQKLDEYKVDRYRIVGTSAVREAENRDYMISRVRHALGMEIEILSNSEERYYHHLALSEAFRAFETLIEEGTLLLDMGAGSIQISTYDKGSAVYSENLRLGYLRVSELFSELQIKTTDFPRIMDEYIGAQLTSILRLKPEGMQYRHLIATGSELYYLGKLAGQDTRKKPYLTAKQFATAFDRLLQTHPIALTTELGVPADVAEILLPAALILNKYFNDDQMEGIYLPYANLCEGVLTDMAEEEYRYRGRYDHREDLLATAEQLAIRYRSNMGHTRQTEELALEIFRSLARRFKLTRGDAFLLRLACRLFDIGAFVDTSESSRHVRHLILMSELIGLSRKEQELVAYVASFGQREELTIPDYLRYRSQGFREKVLQLSAILRLAAALDASRTQKIEGLEAKLKKQLLTLTLTVTRDVELELWAVEQKKRLLCELLGLELRIRTVNPELDPPKGA